MTIRRRLGPIIAWGMGLVPLVLWLLGGGLEGPGGRGSQAGTRSLVMVGQVAGLVGLAMLSVSVILSARLRWLEDLFGGLDRMYRVHHRVGFVGVGVLLLHPLVLAFRFVPEEALRFLLPGHRRVAVDLGVYAFWSILLLIGLTLTTRIPYDKWKLSHKAFGLVLCAGAGHMLFVESTPGLPVAVVEQPDLRLYMTGIVVLGIVGVVYKTLILPFLPHPRYTVTAVHRLNGDVIEIELSPQDEHLDYVSGQFVFVTFHSDSLTHEAHPYTLCGSSETSTLTITVKALGDYTSRLYEHVEPGIEATLEGPYGRFDYRSGGDRQIWIAGGVGVAPFIGWARTMAASDTPSREVEFYYCVHDRSDAVYREEFEALSRQLPGVDVKLVCSVENGHLRARNVDSVDQADIFLCGPKRLTQDLRRQFRRRGVPDERIHFEDFEFR